MSLGEKRKRKAKINLDCLSLETRMTDKSFKNCRTPENDEHLTSPKRIRTIGGRKKRHRTPATLVMSYRITSRDSTCKANTLGDEEKNTVDQ